MATETRVLISKAPYSDGYEAFIRWNGRVDYYLFHDQIDLAGKLVDDGVDQPTIDAAMDTLDAVEWGEHATYDTALSCPAPAVVDPTKLAYEAFTYRTERDMWKWNFAVSLVAVGVLGLVAGVLAWRAGA